MIVTYNDNKSKDSNLDENTDPDSGAILRLD